MMEIFKSFSFDSAHRMPGFPEDHKYGQLHGHSYEVEVHIHGPVEDDSGWVMDIGALTTTVQPLVDTLDHVYLNDVTGLEKPTCENIARWFWNQLQPLMPNLSKIIIRRANAGGCMYRGPAQDQQIT